MTAAERPQGITRRSLLGAAATSALAAAATTTGFVRAGSHTPFRLVVEQHELRIDRTTPADVAAAMGSGSIESFMMLGASLRRGGDLLRLADVRVRTRGSDGWSPWTALPFAVDEGPDADEAVAKPNRASQPLWVGESDGLILDVPADLAPDLVVHLVRETPVVLDVHSDVLPALTESPRPSIHSRAEWNARAPSVAPIYNSELKVAIVHHTAGSNGYTAGQVPGIIKAIQSYHMDANGWNDIAYNFLVDRFGRVWEGRYGGVTKIVRGGHTAGFNTSTTGIAVLGNHQTTAAGGAAVSSAAVSGVASIVAWKLGLHGRDVSTTVMYTAGAGAKRSDYPQGTTKSVPVLTMHGDLGVTSCPGNSLRAQIPAIRQGAYNRQIGLSDVLVTAYYAAPVSWLVRRDITTGVGDTGLFQPSSVVTRAQMVVFLWRMMGSPLGYPAHGFPDVSSTSYYDKAVRWAKATGLTTGVGSTGRFEPNQGVNRASMATFLHRVSGLKPPPSRHSFPDVPRGSWYDDAVSWASHYGITTGVGDTGRYKPFDLVTRGQMAAFLHRTAGTATAWNATPPPTAP